MENILILFRSTHDTIKAERLLKKSGMECKIVPRPHTVSDVCGIALLIEDDIDNYLLVLSDAGMTDFKLYNREH